MSYMNSRLKGFGFGKRKSTASIQTTDGVPPAGTPPPGHPPAQIPQHQAPLPGQTPPIGAASSTTSLPMNHPGAGNRPPSYTANYPPAGPGDRPPPINTGAPVGYPPPNMAAMGQGPPPMGGPPQGGPGGPPPGLVHHRDILPVLLRLREVPLRKQFQRPNPNPAAEVEGASKSKAQLIVGIDFVRYHLSGVAFAFATNNEAKEDIITEWPGAGSYTKQKIPTVLYYDQYQKVVGWGPDIADALAPTGYPKPGVQKVEWFKLQLMLSGNTYIDPINLPPLPPGKSEIDVAADYLFKLRQAMRSALQKTLGEVFNREERNIRYYLTVPAHLERCW
ncbi:hypothetical protein J3459_021527 [Metarhizium acridum]|nr:hypothetical protein J3459_021527 [Metarhizium acridum]